MFQQEAGHICAACGASNAPEASFCGECGQTLPGVAGSPTAGWLPAQSPAGFDAAYPPSPEPFKEEQAGSAYAGLESAEGASEAPEGQVAQKRCAWCSNLSTWTATTCEHCGAHFPVPEQDAAFQRAAEERMRQDIESLNFLSQRRRRGWRRFII